MKLFYSKIGSRTININGELVKFVDCVAEVADDFGKEALELGLPGLYEHGKQPVYETPKEIQMMSDFKDKEDFYQGEIARLKGMCESYKKKIEGLEVEVKNWKDEYNKEHAAFVKFAEEVSKEALQAPKDEAPAPAPEEAPEKPAEGTGAESESADDAELRKELSEMKKDDLVAFAEKECKIDSAELKGLKKDEIIDRIITSSKAE